MISTEQAAAAPACWWCAKATSDSPLFCAECAKVQPTPSNIDYFQVFGLDRKLTLDVAALEKQFYRLSRKLHPDLFARASDGEQQWSLASTSLLNDAYRTLKDPIARTEYLLKLEGVQMTEGESGQDGGAARKRVDPSRVPADLLEEVFELNMQLEEMRMNAQTGEDDPQLRADLEAAKVQFAAQLASTDAQLDAERARWDSALASADGAEKQQSSKQQSRDKMVTLLDRRRYVSNLVRDVNEALGA